MSQTIEQPPKQPGLAGLVAGILLMVLGPIIGVILIVTSSVGSVSGVLTAPSYASGSTASVSLNGGTVMGIWSTDGNATCTIVDPSGNTMQANPGVMQSNVNNYRLAATFTPATTGTYSVTCVTATSTNYVIAPNINVGALAGGIIAGIFAIILCGLGGLILLIVTLVRRSNWRNKYQQVPYPGPGAYPPVAYPQPVVYPQPGTPGTPPPSNS